MSQGTRGSDFVRDAVVPVRAPYRLDLTAAVLRRLSTNVVDVFAGGVYRRLVGPPGAPTLFSATQPAPDRLALRLEGPEAARLDAAAIAQRTLGIDRNTDAFLHGARRFPWLHRLAGAVGGVKPPRYASLWEALCNAIVYQQVSIHAAGAILRRVIERYGHACETDGARLVPFFAPQTILDADPQELRALGLSLNKVAALQSAAGAIADGTLTENALDPLPTPGLIEALVAQRGIGPWTAAVVALRGFGRLDVFPGNDSGVARNLRELSGDPAADLDALLAALAPQQGMLYYHLLLGRLAAAGEVVL